MPKSCNAKVCCVKCHREVTRINFDRHYNACGNIKPRLDPIPDDLICRHCSKQCKNKLSFRTHERSCPSNPNRNYKNGMKGKRGKNQFIKARELGLPVPDGPMKNKPGTMKGKKHAEETKKLMSEKRKKYLKENPDKHPWKNRNKSISEPCEKVKCFLSNQGIEFVPEWTPLTDRHYSIDIAFPDIKLGIEINGNQHYDAKGNLLPYYQERHDLITKAGWTLLELHYSIA